VRCAAHPERCILFVDCRRCHTHAAHAAPPLYLIIPPFCAADQRPLSSPNAEHRIAAPSNSLCYSTSVGAFWSPPRVVCCLGGVICGYYATAALGVWVLDPDGRQRASDSGCRTRAARAPRPFSGLVRVCPRALALACPI
jgi:hypothetical protein